MEPAPPSVSGTQLSLLLHLLNHRREILLVSLLRLRCINLERSFGRGHSRLNFSREVQNQPEILLHEPQWKLRAILATHCFLQFSHMHRCDNGSLGQHFEQAGALETSLLAERNGLRDRL